MNRLILSLFPVVCAFTGIASGEPTRPVIPAAQFEVTKFGGAGDGQTDNTAALQRAIDTAADAGGGSVVFPASGRPYLSGPLQLRSRVALHLEKGATLQALPYGAGRNTSGTYPLGVRSYANFITADQAHDIALTGEGTVEGDGAAWWAAFRADKAMPHRPFLVRFAGCTNVLVADLTLANSPMFHLAFNTTDHVTIEGITIRAPEEAPNSDGIDPAGSHYLIRHCRISTGDDNIAVKAGNTFCSDLMITDCEFGTGHGLSVGGQSTRGLDGMTVTRCTFNGTTSGLRLKADATQGGPVRNITYSDLTMTDVKYPIVFYSYYNKTGNPGSGKNPPARAAEWNATPPNSLSSSRIPTWENITINNLTVTGATGQSVIWGLPLARGFIAKVKFVNLRYAGERGFLLYDAQNVQFSNADFQLPAGTPSVTAYNALAILAQPSSQSVATGASVAFEVAVANPSGAKATTPAFQWTCDGNRVSDKTKSDGMIVAGATTAKLVLSNVQSGAAGHYVVTVAAELDVFDVAAGKLLAAGAPVQATSSPAELVIAAPAK